MAEYIERQAAIDAFNRIKNTLKNPQTAHYDTLMFYEIEDVLEDVEPADVVQVRHGKWLPTNDDNKKRCNKCDTVVLIAMYPMGGANYCPNCGAKMDREE